MIVVSFSEWLGLEILCFPCRLVTLRFLSYFLKNLNGFLADFPPQKFFLIFFNRPLYKFLISSDWISIHIWGKLLTSVPKYIHKLASHIGPLKVVNYVLNFIFIPCIVQELFNFSNLLIFYFRGYLWHDI